MPVLGASWLTGPAKVSAHVPVPMCYEGRYAWYDFGFNGRGHTNGQRVQFVSNGFNHISQWWFTNRFCGRTNDLFNNVSTVSSPYYTNSYAITNSLNTNSGLFFDGTFWLSSWGTNYPGFFHVNRSTVDAGGYVIFMCTSHSESSRVPVGLQYSNATDMSECLQYPVNVTEPRILYVQNGVYDYLQVGGAFQFDRRKVVSSGFWQGALDSTPIWPMIRSNGTNSIVVTNRNASTSGMTNGSNRRIWIGRRGVSELVMA